MKNLLKRTSVLVLSMLVMATVLSSCSDDEDVAPELTQIAYSTNTISVQTATAISSVTPTISPSGAEATIAIKEIEKDSQAFTNPTNGFKISTEGVLSLEASNTLEAGTYVLTIEATDKNDNTIKKTTTFTFTVTAS